MSDSKILEEDQENKNVSEVKKRSVKLLQTDRYLLNKFNMDRLRRDLRKHPEYIHLVAYIQKIIDKKSMQIKRLKRKVFLLEEKCRIPNVEQSTHTADNSKENVTIDSDKSDEVDSSSLSLTGNSDKSNKHLEITDKPYSLRVKAEVINVDQFTQTENITSEFNKSDNTAKSEEHSITENPNLAIGECKLSNVEQSTQTEDASSELNKGDGVLASSWRSSDITKSNEQLSIAEQVKQVAENVIADAGMVYVESAGMYYDSKSGYYYSPELGLYYHSTTGCYYYFDKEKNEFCYYSHANTSQQNLQEDNQQNLLLQHPNEKKSGSRKKHKKDKHVSNEEVEYRKNAKRKALNDTSHKKKVKKDHEKDLGKRSGHKKQRTPDNKKKRQFEATDSDFTENSKDAQHKKKDYRLKEEVEDENQDSITLSQAVKFSGESNEVNLKKEVDSEVEDGECSSSEAEAEAEAKAEAEAEAQCDSNYSSSASSSSSDDSSFDETVAKHHPPCIRIMVKETSLERLKVGSLFIVTMDGGSLGREGSYHSVIVPDQNVSRHHLNFHYDIKNKCYDVVDVGSQNGTLLNGKRMSVAKQESERMKLVHGSTLTFGGTTLLCHVHDGNDTCGHCEPGLIKCDNEGKERTAYKPATNLRKQYKQELQRLRSKYADKGHASREGGAGGEGDKYTDRAAMRRETQGSTHSAEKTEQGDLHTSITESNKGFKMLEKMGWSKGEGLGKQKQGETDPVPLVSNEGSSGLGAGGVGAVTVAPAMWRPRPLRRPLVKAVAKAFRQNDAEEDDEE